MSSKLTPGSILTTSQKKFLRTAIRTPPPNVKLTLSLRKTTKLLQKISESKVDGFSQVSESNIISKSNPKLSLYNLFNFVFKPRTF